MILSEDRATQRNRLELVPGKLWSLWDIMRHFPIERMLQATMRGDSLSISRNDPDVIAAINLGASSRQEVLWFCEDVDQCCAAAELDSIAKFTKDLKNHITSGVKVTPMEAFTSVAYIGDMLQDAISQHWFMRMEAYERKAYEHPHYFGEVVWGAFPSARLDIAEAGNCFACGRYNASAYHCVQAAEIGLRVLARDRRVEPKAYNKPIPLDQAQWGEVLKQLEQKVGDVRTWPRGAAKDAAQIFYERALQEANALNDGWRRHLSHARTHEFQRDEIEALIGHSRRFLERIATRAAEGKKPTSPIWKSPSAGLRRS